jgi:orotate phosphoribosyltransferase
VQCAQLLQHPERSERVGRALSRYAPPADLALSPALGGLVLGHEVGRALRLRHLFCEREDGRFVLRRGFRIKPDERVVVVEDVFTTGKSTREVMAVVHEHGGKVVAALSLVFRGQASLAFGVPTHSLVRLPLDTYPEADCPLCQEGLPVVKPGSRPKGAAGVGPIHD